MNADELLEDVSFTGEFWIYSDGDVHYCDGDVGDENHEMHAMSHARSELYDRLNISEDEYDDPDTTAEKVANRLLQELDEEDAAGLREKHGDDPAWLVHVLMKNSKNDAMLGLFEIATGMGDPREYAAKHWGWSALRGHHIETWKINKKSLRAIARGIDNIADEEGFDPYDEEADLDDTVFYIVEYGGNRSLKVTYKQLNAEAFEQGETTGTSTPHAASAAVSKMDTQLQHPFYAGRQESASRILRLCKQIK